MANITKDSRRVNKAQEVYDDSLDNFLKMIEDINKDIPEICDILHGVAMGKTTGKYNVNARQLQQLEKQLSVWKANVQNPDKVLSSLNNELKKKFNSDKDQQKSSTKPKVAVATFSSTAQ
jgi:Mg2+ and Co2+ transporter CorA